MFQKNVLSDSTKEAYRKDLQRFLDWGGTFPAPPQTIADYFMAHAATHKYATLKRWKVAIAKAHTTHNFDDPTKQEVIYDTLCRIQKTYGKEQRKMLPLNKEHVIDMVSAMGTQRKDLRDKAILLLGFALGLQRRDFLPLKKQHIAFEKKGMQIKLHGNTIAVPFGTGMMCPVKALREWLSVSEIKEGAIFRGINRHNQLSESISGHSISKIIKCWVESIGLEPHLYSSISLRSGLTVSAKAMGISVPEIKSHNWVGIF